jgi:hypothetical protein
VDLWQSYSGYSGSLVLGEAELEGARRRKGKAMGRPGDNAAKACPLAIYKVDLDGPKNIQ